MFFVTADLSFLQSKNLFRKGMNWKVKLVLLFANLRKPIHATSYAHIGDLRSVATRAAKLGTFFFDKKIAIKSVEDTLADTVPVRIYNNKSTSKQRVIVYYHGGGFVLYNLEAHDNVCRRLCRDNNAIVVSVDYRLAPEFTFPAAHNDAFEALLWVKKNIGKYGGDAENIVVAGDSAGGNLAACMAHRCIKNNIKLKAQILIYPWIDGKLKNPSIDRNGSGYMLEKETMFWFQKVYVPNEVERLIPEVSPCYESDFTKLPPAFIITGEFDPLIDDGYNYFTQLSKAKVMVKYKEYLELFHGFFNLPLMHVNVLHCYDDIRNFLAMIK